jgi:hypothetical protein
MDAYGFLQYLGEREAIEEQKLDKLARLEVEGRLKPLFPRHLAETRPARFPRETR